MEGTTACIFGLEGGRTGKRKIFAAHTHTHTALHCMVVLCSGSLSLLLCSRFLSLSGGLSAGSPLFLYSYVSFCMLSFSLLLMPAATPLYSILLCSSVLPNPPSILLRSQDLLSLSLFGSQTLLLPCIFYTLHFPP